MLEESAGVQCVVCVKSERLIFLDKDLEFPGSNLGNICMTIVVLVMVQGNLKHLVRKSISPATRYQKNLSASQFNVILLCQPQRWREDIWHVPNCGKPEQLLQAEDCCTLSARRSVTPAHSYWQPSSHITAHNQIFFCIFLYYFTWLIFYIWFLANLFFIYINIYLWTKCFCNYRNLPMWYE